MEMAKLVLVAAYSRNCCVHLKFFILYNTVLSNCLQIVLILDSLELQQMHTDRMLISGRRLGRNAYYTGCAENVNKFGKAKLSSEVR